MSLSAFLPGRVSARAILPALSPAVFIALLLPVDAAALSRRDQAAVDGIGQRMLAAEAKYREAMVMAGNADPEGTRLGDEALEDMEDAMADCAKQRGCSPTTLLATYKRLLKLNTDAQEPFAGEHGPDDADPDHVDLAQGESDPFAADVPEAARAAALLDDRRHRFDEMVKYNPAVQAGIRRWLTDMRPSLMNSYENYQYMRHLMWPHYERAGLPEALLFGIMAKESNGKVHARSRAGAAGPMQFMYATGQRFGLGKDSHGFDTRFDPYAASEASVRYLNERMGELNRNIELALAAYNGGEGRARRIHQAHPGKDFWDEAVYNEFPAETRDYVPMVIAAAWLFLHPKQYGIEFPKVDPRPAALTLSQPSSIYQLTICLGNGGTRDGYMRALRNLNPRYEADSVLPSGTVLNATTRIAGLYNRWCSRGARAELARTLVLSDPDRAIVRTGAVTPVAAAPAASDGGVRPRVYKVQRGETLTSIARKFSCGTGQLARTNNIRPPRYTIRPGQQLSLEGCDG
ncbi:transglycosylase SLT domain-containing protein [Marilutibacter chinensis]|uniref:Transglycosylase SLT domain-containing protein n=1 Tax=Marilutibacter chinensis TaxID=2912247 RepID=A0ABS9HWA6_9GAMM|nr:transglycosylase SLT domain-containing protein [Lysobacter chinensis]MCF7223184.1 transglycosylase SLT domain-containing protein [Lysobacter chinensis]